MACASSSATGMFSLSPIPRPTDTSTSSLVMSTSPASAWITSTKRRRAGANATAPDRSTTLPPAAGRSSGRKLPLRTLSTAPAAMSAAMWVCACPLNS